MDLFTAAISEKHLPGSKLGPTFTCILALQFRALKYGDRFFYEGHSNFERCTNYIESL
jgi:peroxidase